MQILGRFIRFTYLFKQEIKQNLFSKFEFELEKIKKILYVYDLRKEPIWKVQIKRTNAKTKLIMWSSIIRMLNFENKSCELKFEKKLPSWIMISKRSPSRKEAQF